MSPSQFPPPPPGYVYSPTPYYSGDQAASPELMQIEARLHELSRARRAHPIGGPIALMATGYGIGALSGLAALLSYASAESIDDGEWHDSEYQSYDERDEREERASARGFAAVAVIGVAVGIGGTVFLSKRLAQRRVYSPEIRALRERRRDLLRGLRYGANAGPGQLRLSLNGSF